MFARNACLLSVMLLLFAVAPFSSAQSARDDVPLSAITPSQNGLIEKCILPSVKIVSVKDRDGVDVRSSGSGTVLNEKYILTAAHVVDDAVDIFAYISPDNIEVPCTIVCRGDMAAVDYAILEVGSSYLDNGALLPGVDREIFQPEYFAEIISEGSFDDLSTGQDLFAVGYPLGGEVHITKGMLCAAVDGFYTTSVPVIYGNSGGAVFSSDYRLVGIVVRIAISGWTPISHISFIVPISSIWADVESQGCDYIWEADPAPEPTEPIPEEPQDIDPEQEPDDEGDEETEPEEPADHTLAIGPYLTIPLIVVR